MLLLSRKSTNRTGTSLTLDLFFEFLYKVNGATRWIPQMFVDLFDSPELVERGRHVSPGLQSKVRQKSCNRQEQVEQPAYATGVDGHKRTVHRVLRQYKW